MEPWAVLLVTTVAAGVGAWVVDRRRRGYADLPTSPAAAVFAGRNEVKGRAWTASPLVSFATRSPTVWWDRTLEEEREHTRTVTSTSGDGKTQTRTERYRQWHQVEHHAGALDAFDVVDETGSVSVRLHDARVVPRQLRRETFRDDGGRGLLAAMFDNRTGRYRETERAIVVGDELYVVGEAVLDEQTCVPCLHGDVLVSTRTEESHRSWLGAAVAALVLVAIAAAGATSASMLDPVRMQPLAWVPGLLLALGALTVAWAITVHNRLRLVAQGVERAWSLIDVQLQRRADLVPALAHVVAGHADHERDLLGALVHERWRAGCATGAAELADEAAEQASALREVLGVSERYPSLTADASFARLHAELVDSEDRIAASRTFYNGSLTLLRDRSQSFPGLLIARRLPLGHREELRAEGFERTAPAVPRTFA